MLTRHATRYILLFSLLLVLGLLLGNRIVLTMSLLPLCMIILGLIVVPPGHFALKQADIASRVWVGDALEIKIVFSVGAGLGPFACFQELPPHFALAEGNNLRVFWKGWRPAEFSFVYKVRCTKRGVYSLPALKWESNQFLLLTRTRDGSLGEPREVTVHPKLLNVRRIRGLPGIASSPFPVIDIARIGVATTDFREIRNYVYGDPVKNINWKATARNASPQAWPLTNEYEVEGKKAVWLFLDASRLLEVGTNIENAFEYCLEAAGGVAYYFLDRGYMVGMYIFNDGGKVFYPDAGRKQYLKISRELLGLKAGGQYDEFPAAVEKCRGYLLGYNPLCVIISGLDNRLGDSLISGVRAIKKYSGRRRQKLPVMFINIPGYNLAPGDSEYNSNAAALTRLGSRPRISRLRGLGASVLDWNPRKESFGNALLKQVKARK
jgi:uncharacterized protein (DUF58 family)